MWSKHRDFWPIINLEIATYGGPFSLQQLGRYLAHLRAKLRILNKDHFANLRSQQSKARSELDKIQSALQDDPSNDHLHHQEKEVREKYIDDLSSSLSLIQQQTKMEWITQGDDNTRFFFAKAKQRKLSTYIYTIKDDQGNQVEGFEQVGNVMLQFYKKLMRK